MEVPEDVQVGLRNIRPRMQARWNPRRVLKRGWSYDVNGSPRGREYEGRWEIWDTDEHGVEYRIMTLVDDAGAFVPLGYWVVEMIGFLNPERFNGDMNKMVEELVDKPNAEVDRISQAQYEHLIDYLADVGWHDYSRQGRVNVLKPVVSPPNQLM